MAVASRVSTTFGKYIITRLLGRGGMGEVYEDFDRGKGQTVALKILADEFSNDVTFRTRFQRESQAAAILQEPHVIPIHDRGEIDGSHLRSHVGMKPFERHRLPAPRPIPPAGPRPRVDRPHRRLTRRLPIWSRGGVTTNLLAAQ